MTEKDKELIARAKALHWSEWHLVADMEEQADTEEARAILHDIRRDNCVKEKNSADYFSLYE